MTISGIFLFIIQNITAIKSTLQIRLKVSNFWGAVQKAGLLTEYHLENKVGIHKFRIVFRHHRSQHTFVVIRLFCRNH